MNREIKFRGLYKNIWVKGNLLVVTANDGSVTYQIERSVQSDFAKYEVDGKSVGQFTGREDAQINGNEVWESDIIENCDTKELQVVYWNEDEASWYCRYVNDESRIVSLADSLGNLNKKIGNIYESPLAEG